MARNNYYFYLSGLLSFLFFGMVIILFTLLVLTSVKIKSYALKKENYISVSIMMEQKIPTKSRAKPAAKPEPKPISKSEPELIPDKVPDISSLFSDVKTQKIVHKKKPKKPKKVVDQKRIAAMQKRIKTAKTEKSSKASSKVKTLNLAKPSVKEVGSAASGGAEVNKYYARIQAFVYEQFYPPANTEGQIAKIYIKLDSRGRLQEYRVLLYSSNSMFNMEVDHLKKRLLSLTFPKHPDLRPVSLNIDLISEE